MICLRRAHLNHSISRRNLCVFSTVFGISFPDFWNTKVKPRGGSGFTPDPNRPMNAISSLGMIEARGAGAHTGYVFQSGLQNVSTLKVCTCCPSSPKVVLAQMVRGSGNTHTKGTIGLIVRWSTPPRQTICQFADITSDATEWERLNPRSPALFAGVLSERMRFMRLSYSSRSGSP